MVPVFKNVGERSAKNYHPFSILSVVRKVFEKPVGLNASLFSDFQYGFRSS